MARAQKQCPSPGRRGKQVSLRSAATLLVARDASPLEVLVIERPDKMRFAPGAHVFPGGVLDSDDGELVRRMADRCDGWSDEKASESLGVSAGGLAFWVAAVRECFEEVGLLFARHRQGGEAVSLAQPGIRERFERHRQELCRGRLTFAELVVGEDLVLDLGRVTYLSRWITPPGRPLRYDTRFFVADAPSDQVASQWSSESVNLTWAPPGRLLERSRAGEIRLLTPTARTLRWAAGFSSVSGLLGAVEQATGVLPVQISYPACQDPTVSQSTRPALTFTES